MQRAITISSVILKGPYIPPVDDRTPPCLPTHSLPALSAISSSTQHNARNATYVRSGQWRGWNLLRDMTCVKLEACFGPCVAWISLAYGAVRRCSPVRYGDAVAVGLRASMYGAVKPVHTAYNDAFCTYTRGSRATSPYAHVRQCTAP